MSRLLIISGLILIVAGIAVAVLPKIPWIGRMPGDILVKRENMTIYFPVVTCLILSLVMSFILFMINR